MPSPFPGIDPYLETPQFWRGNHNGLIYELFGTLNQVLPPGFAALYEERVIVLPAGRSFIPDMLLKTREPYPPFSSVAATAVLDSPTAHGIIRIEEEEIYEGYIEIVTTDSREQILTVIEVLSPTNKKAGQSQEEYQDKQRTTIQSRINLLEIDLLRGGMHTVAAPQSLLEERGAWDGIVCLSRAEHPKEFEYWFCRMSEPLPAIRVPLMAGIEEISLSLQAAYSSVYDKGPYHRLAEYHLPPPIPFTKEESLWADTLLREKGLRT